jgi:hypothetical protein
LLDHSADDSIFARIKLSPEHDIHNDEPYDDENGDGVHPPSPFSQREKAQLDIEH